MPEIRDRKTTRQIQKSVAVDINEIAVFGFFKKYRKRLSNKRDLRTFESFERLREFGRMRAGQCFGSNFG